jgi:diguanylate cyclase (GGDEF)-like protein
LFDIENFKNINDTYGHLSGDAALRSVAGLIWETGRNTDTIARYGGEEFAVILPETDMKGAAIFAERVRKKIETNLIAVDNMKTRVTVSMGIFVYDPNKGKRDKDEFVKAADKALYNSKNSGKNKISIASL